MANAKITYLENKQLQQQGRFNELGLECTLDNKIFKKGDTLNKTEIKKVLKICNKHRDFYTNTLIIRDGYLLTI